MTTTATPDGHLADQADQRREVEAVVGHAEGQGGGQGDEAPSAVRPRPRRPAPAKTATPPEVGDGAGLRLEGPGPVHDAGPRATTMTRGVTTTVTTKATAPIAGPVNCGPCPTPVRTRDGPTA